jgi:murein DD-endopeptidase MepM/ murein hydrolase activator NlpD
MRKGVFGIGVIVLLLIFLAFKTASTKPSYGNKSSSNKTITQPPIHSPTTTSAPSSGGFQPPLNKASQRVTKKMFGTYVTPQNSPVQPERFMGYHTGADFETFSDEKTKDIPVHAVCSGKLILKEYVSGYGGVTAQSCTLNNEDITVIYGHMRLASISFNPGDTVKTGDVMGVLGTGYSSETDGERKHLHLGFHKGTATNILGYVSSEDRLSSWIDPCLYVCKN